MVGNGNFWESTNSGANWNYLGQLTNFNNTISSTFPALGVINGQNGPLFVMANPSRNGIWTGG